MMKIAILIFALAACSAYEHQGSQLFRVEENTENANLQRAVVSKLNTLQANFNIDFWLDPRPRGPIDFLVTSEQHEFVISYLKANGIKHKVMIEDVGALIEEQRLEALATINQNGGMNWTQYQRVSTIHDFMDSIAAANPDLTTVEIIGTSTEGRDIKLIKVGRPQPGVNKPAIFMDGGIHAREWISPAIVTFFINELLTKQTENADLLDNIDFHFIPVLNLDGYEFSHTSTRLWRKTRSNHDHATCRGADPNRNFAYGWGGPGTSADKCSDIYKGPIAFSEPETTAMRNYIERESNAGANWRSYFAIHSYAQMWLTPWGNTYDLPEDFDELYAYGRRAADSLTAVHGTRYDVGSVTQLLSPGAGGSDDWAKGSGYFKFSQTVEVRDTGRYGFVLPPAQIIPTGEETWAGVQTAARDLIQN